MKRGKKGRSHIRSRYSKRPKSRRTKGLDRQALIIGGLVAGFIIILIVTLALASGSEDSKITGNSLKEAVKSVPVKVKQTVSDKIDNFRDCKAIICFDNKKEIFCKDSFSECDNRFSDCRIVWCPADDSQDSAEDKSSDQESQEYAYRSYDSSTDDPEDKNYCSEEYNDCVTDDGESIICHGSFEDCLNSFASCSCGTESSSYDTSPGSSTIDFNKDASEMEKKTLSCTTGVFICDKVSLSSDGTPTTSKVECKSSFAECSRIYGECSCGNRSSWFDPGSSDIKMCDWHDRKVPCSELNVSDCHEKRHTCYKGDGVIVNCDGSFDYCNNRYEGECLCGLVDID